MRTFVIAAIFVAAIVPLSAANAWRDNLTRAQVIAALGRPESDLRGGNRESMAYPGGVTIELQNGVVTNIEGTVPAALTPGAPLPSTAAAPAPAIAPASVPTATPVAPPTQVAVTSAPAPAVAPAAPPPKPAASPAAVPAASSAPVATDSGKTTTKSAGGKEDFDTTVEDYSKPGIIPNGALPEGLPKGLTLPGMTPEQPSNPNDWTKPNNLLGFFAGLLIKTVVMAGVIKGVFMYKDFPILWREVLPVAGGVALCNQVLAFLFTLNSFGEIAAMVQADQLVAAVVLLTLIMNFTSAKQFPTAAGITVTAIGVNIVVGYAMLFIM